MSSVLVVAIEGVGWSQFVSSTHFVYHFISVVHCAVNIIAALTSHNLVSCINIKIDMYMYNL